MLIVTALILVYMEIYYKLNSNKRLYYNKKHIF